MIAKTYLFCFQMLFLLSFFSKCGDSPQKDRPEVKYDTAETINKIINGDSNFYWFDTGKAIIKLGNENNFISSEIIQRNVHPILTDTIYLLPETDSSYIVNVPFGRLQVLIFPDKTKVWLNAGSSMVFSNDIKNSRPIKIYGEGYFEVQKQDKPLTIEFKQSKYHVVYGKIGINTFDDGTPKASVIEGKITVVTKNNVFEMNGPGCFQLKDNHPIKCDPEDANSWSRGFLNLDPTSNCEPFFKCLSRWYNVDFYYTGKDRVCPMGGSIPLNASLKNVLKILESNNIKYDLKLNKDRLQIIVN
jgi:hypothetical protein